MRTGGARSVRSRAQAQVSGVPCAKKYENLHLLVKVLIINVAFSNNLSLLVACDRSMRPPSGSAPSLPVTDGPSSRPGGRVAAGAAPAPGTRALPLSCPAPPPQPPDHLCDQGDGYRK
jgi:hypothetical protein